MSSEKAVETYMKQLKEIPAGQHYALVSQKPTGESFPLFAGEAGNIADDFILAGVLIVSLQRGVPLGVHLNKTQDPNFLTKVKSMK